MARPDEAVVYGRNAALAVARHRPDAVLRVFFNSASRAAAAPFRISQAAGRYRELFAKLAIRE